MTDTVNMTGFICGSEEAPHCYCMTMGSPGNFKDTAQSQCGINLEMFGQEDKLSARAILLKQDQNLDICCVCFHRKLRTSSQLEKFKND